MIEKCWTLPLDAAIEEIVDIIEKEIKFWDNAPSREEILRSLKEEFQFTNFVTKVFEIQNCKIAYNIIHIGDRVAMSSALSLPPTVNLQIGDMNICVTISNISCLNTSQASEIVQLYSSLQYIVHNTQWSCQEKIQYSVFVQELENYSYSILIDNGSHIWSKTFKSKHGDIIVTLSINNTTSDGLIPSDYITAVGYIEGILVA